ncbi:MAG: tRNA (adenosine(37)-N6)-threonylcarbamoyltransferase complex dimerization subunit type 1 TsaB [Dehalococcoidia bacterium]
MELALDTSTATAGVALAHRGETLAEVTWLVGRNHTTQLLPTIEDVLGRAGVTVDDLEAVIVATGPGSFSGLRVGLSTAKGLAVSRDIPLVGVGTLAVEAYPFLSADLPLRALLDAGRGEIAVGSYTASQGQLREAEPPRLTSVDELSASIVQRTLLCGEHLPVVQEAIAERLGSLAVFPSRSALLRRPGHLAELGWQRLALGDSDDPATLQPLYLRAPSITRPRPPRTTAAKRSP